MLVYPNQAQLIDMCCVLTQHDRLTVTIING